MIRVDYIMRALTPIFTGSDENAGTIKTFRRGKIKIKNIEIIQSKFKSEAERRQSIVAIL